MYKGGPYGPNHATAGTFAFRRELLNQTRYNDEACLAEEREFLKNYTVPFVQLDPFKTILVFSHVQNTFDKKKLLETPNPRFVPCDRKVSEFIRKDFERPIHDYFMEKIDAALESYSPGNPVMKPDVLKQTKELEKERAEMQKQMSSQAQIVLQRPGQEPKVLNTQDIVQLLESQKKEIDVRTKTIQELQQLLQPDGMMNEINRRGTQIQILEKIVKQLKEEIETLKTSRTTCSSDTTPVSKTIPEVMVEIPVC